MKFKGRMLQISWYKPKTPSVTAEPEEEDPKEEDIAVGIALLSPVPSHTALSRLTCPSRGVTLGDPQGF